MAKKVYCCRRLTEEQLAQALALGCLHVITNAIEVALDRIPPSLVVSSALEHRIEGSWASLQFIEQRLLHIRKHCPALFTYRGMDLTIPMLKLCYWQEARENSIGNLMVAAQKLEAQQPGAYTFIYEDREPLRTSVRALAGMLRRAVREKVQQSASLQPANTPILFFYSTSSSINHDLELLKGFAPEEVCCWYIAEDAAISDEVRKWGGACVPIALGSAQGLPAVNPFRLKPAYWPLLNVVLAGYAEMSALADAVIDSGFRVIVSTAEENSHWGHLLWACKKLRNFQTVNKMLGIKAPSANNAFARFDHWVVWDEQMKELLVSGCGLDAAQFAVIGHPNEDRIRQHRYQGSIPVSQEWTEGKKVISYIDVYDLRQEKIVLLDALYDFLRAHPDVLLLYRPKKGNVKNEVYLPDASLMENQVRVIDYEEHNRLDTLFDQLLVSDVTVCMGSTVALESRFLQTPVITFETAEQSLLYFVDGVQVRHVRTVGELRAALQGLRHKDRMKISEARPVLPQYVELIRQAAEKNMAPA